MYNKMSSQYSLLNVSSSNYSEEFNLKDIEVLIDDKEQPRIKQTHIGRYIGLASMITWTIKLAEQDMKSRAWLQAQKIQVNAFCTTCKMDLIELFYVKNW